MLLKQLVGARFCCENFTTKKSQSEASSFFQGESQNIEETCTGRESQWDPQVPRLNNTTLIVIATFNIQQQQPLRGGRPASTSQGSPHGGLVIAGKPGISLALSCSGFSRSPLPALRRQESSFAWRFRLRNAHRPKRMTMARGDLQEARSMLLDLTCCPTSAHVGLMTKNMFAPLVDLLLQML